jgi:hypothetical protein
LVTRGLGRGSGADPLLGSLKGSGKRMSVPDPLLGSLVIKMTLGEEGEGGGGKKEKKNERFAREMSLFRAGQKCINTVPNLVLTLILMM